MSFSETIFLFFLALIIFGPKKLPEIARQIGKYLNEFKRASNEFKSQIEQEISHLETENKTQILTPGRAPEGATSRNLNTANEAAAITDPPATLAASPEPSAESNPPQQPAVVATEAVVAYNDGSDAIASSDSVNSDPVSVSSSQESHA